MAAIHDQAIVLRRLDYSETSQVLFFLTRLHGPRRLLAKGIKRGTKKRFATGIDLLERGEVLFSARSSSDSSLGALMEWRQLDAYLGLRGNLQRLYAAQYAAEITSGVLQEFDPHPETFDALAGLLEALASGTEPLPAVVDYQRALLTSIGLWPDLNRCVVCGRTAPPGRAAYFSANQGGLICRTCEPGHAERQMIKGPILEALRTGGYSGETAGAAFDLLDHTLAHTRGRRTALARLVRRETP